MSSWQQQTGARCWSGRLLAAKRPRVLPIKVDCSQAGLELSVNYALEQEVTAVLPKLLKESSLRGDNVGIDETGEVHFEYVTKMADIFAVRRSSPTDIHSDDPHDIAAFMIIGLSTYSWTYDSCLADIRVVRDRYVSDNAYIDMTKMAVELTKQLDCGFTDCLIPVAKSCDQLIRALIGQLGFSVAFTLPLSVAINMADSVELTDSLLMAYNLGVTNRPQRPTTDILEYLAKIGIVDGPDDDAWYQSLTLPRMPFLPVQYRFQKSGILANLRPMERNEDKVVYELLNAAAQQGEGFDVNTSPNLASFRRIFLAASTPIILEDAERTNIFGWMNVFPSWIARSPLAEYGEVITVLAKEYQNRKIGSELTWLILGLAKQLGYKRIVLDHFSNNIRAGNTCKMVATVEVGAIPRSGYSVGNGWTDVTVTCKDISADSQLTFLELVERNRKQQKSDLSPSHRVLHKSKL